MTRRSPTSQPLPLRSMGRERKGFIRVGHLAYTRRAAKQLVSPASSHQPATNAPPLSVTLLLSSIHDAPVTWSPRPWPMDSGCRALADTTSRRTRTYNAATTRSRQPSNPAPQHPLALRCTCPSESTRASVCHATIYVCVYDVPSTKVIHGATWSSPLPSGLSLLCHPNPTATGHLASERPHQTPEDTELTIPLNKPSDYQECSAP